MQVKGNLEVIPSAARLVTSLRDVGYDFSHAVADLIDNSLAARASNVDIDVVFSGAETWIRITDNGQGMSQNQLIEAMRFGSQREYDADDLGKFGLGLKTASLSQCRKLIVASRTNPRQRSIIAFAWDVDHLVKTNRWEVLPVPDVSRQELLYDPLKSHPGTAVLWTRVDRFLQYVKPEGKAAHKAFTRMCRDLERHLAMVFHRFLARETHRTFGITLNSNPIAPWDPFARDEQDTTSMPPERILVEEGGLKGTILLQGYILPHQSQFSTNDAFRHAGGPAGWNQQQGLYIYRANRLLQAGGWCKLRAVDEHIKLARVALSFNPSLDPLFRVNVAKMRVELPASVRNDIERYVQPVIAAAQKRYRTAGGKTPSPKPSPQPQSGTTPSRLAPQHKTPSIPKKITPPTASPTRWTLNEFEEMLIACASPPERVMIREVIKRVRLQIESDQP